VSRLLVIGLDCLGAELLQPAALARLPELAKLVANGVSGPLRSSVPPITVPAWTCMFSGRDPGELGLYGFRNRYVPEYDAMVRADSRTVHFPRVWDYVGAAGGRSLVVGVPQTYPPPHIAGALVSGFDTPAGADFKSGLQAACSSPELAARVGEIAPKYRFDMDNFRDSPRAQLLQGLRDMTQARLDVMCSLLREQTWDLAIYCEIGPDRMHHCFWSDHDPAHPNHRSDSPFRDAIWNYYHLLDSGIGRLRAAAGEDVPILVVSDHGARAMLGGICINQWLLREGWLTLKEPVRDQRQLVPDMIDFQRSRAWAYGGYYARIFLNVAGREPQGIVPPEAYSATRDALRDQLATLALSDGRVVPTQTYYPERTFRKVRGQAPDLMVFFDDLRFRSLGSVGHDDIWLQGNDTGTDEANHAWDGLFVYTSPQLTPRSCVRRSILDVAPTMLRHLGLGVPADLQGQDLTSLSAARHREGASTRDEVLS
jgi:predicted AlkP superfamily phosphohydrolase/phosphomutase